MQMSVIGTIRTCFSEKFGVPRQPGMVPSAWGTIRISPEFAPPESELRLESFSHVWVLFVFDRAKTPFHPQDWAATVQTPGNGAPKRVGVYASRSPHRPNPIGMSVLKLESVRRDADQSLCLEVSGVDLLDRTPILDLKPYVPYADRVDAATAGWTLPDSKSYAVSFGPGVEAELSEWAKSEKFNGRPLISLVHETLASDPRPRSQREDAPAEDPSSVGRAFAFRMLGLDFHWRIVEGPRFELVRIERLPAGR